MLGTTALDELLARILDVDPHIKKRGDQLGRRTRYLCTRDSSAL